MKGMVRHYPHTGVCNLRSWKLDGKGDIMHRLKGDTVDYINLIYQIFYERNN